MNTLQPAVDEVTKTIVSQRIGGEIEIDAEMLNSGIIEENYNHPLPENYLNATEEECVYESWGYTSIYNQCQVLSANQKPSLKVINSGAAL